MEQLPSTGAMVGVDLGLRYLAYTSDNRKYENPKHLDKSLKKLARMQRALSRKTIGSANYNRAKHRVARLHEHIANQRRDAQHKLTTALVREHDLICAESLNIRKMLQQGPYLARQISDAGWGEILRQLSYKCAWQHKPFVQIDALFSKHAGLQCLRIPKQGVEQALQRTLGMPLLWEQSMMST